MAEIVKKFAALLASGVMFCALSLPANAIDIGDRNKGLGVSVDIGNAGSKGLGVDIGATVGDRAKGINADAKANVGGSKGLADAKATASVGGRSGINADARANVGGKDLLDAKATASVGGNKGVNADVDAKIGGGGIDAKIDLNIGGNGANSRVVIGRPAPNPVTPRTPSVPGPGINPNIPPIVTKMSDAERVRFQKRCLGILSDQASYDRDLIALCQMLQVASR